MTLERSQYVYLVQDGGMIIEIHTVRYRALPVLKGKSFTWHLVTWNCYTQKQVKDQYPHLDEKLRKEIEAS